jgi:hypothetical protein
MVHVGTSSGEGVGGGRGLEPQGSGPDHAVAGSRSTASTASVDGTRWAVVVPARGLIRVVEFGPSLQRPPGGGPVGGIRAEGARPGRDESGLAFWYREIGCTQVELVDLSRVCRVVLGLASPGLCLWLDEEAGLRDPMSEVNARARRVLVAVWGQRGAPWVRGTAVFTGALDRYGRCQGLSQLAAQALIGVITSDYPGV